MKINWAFQKYTQNSHSGHGRNFICVVYCIPGYIAEGWKQNVETVANANAKLWKINSRHFMAGHQSPAIALALDLVRSQPDACLRMFCTRHTNNSYVIRSTEDNGSKKSRTFCNKMKLTTAIGLCLIIVIFSCGYCADGEYFKENVADVSKGQRSNQKRQLSILLL